MGNRDCESERRRMILDSRTHPGGHRWRRCDACGREALTLEEGKRCRQTPAIAKTSQEGITTYSCPGKLYAQDAPAGKGEGVCSREGCLNGVRVTTARGEELCLRCLGDLAAL